MSDQQSRQSAIACFDTFLRGRRMRVTAERTAILDALLRHRGRHSAESFGRLLESEGFHVSTATIYATFDLLCQAGLLHKHVHSGQSAIYSCAPIGDNKAILVCSNCGKQREVNATIDPVAIPVRKYAGFQPAHQTVYIYGLCRQCKPKKKDK